MSSSVSPGESPIQQAPDAGVPLPPDEVPAPAVASNPGGRRPDDAVGPLEQSSDQQSPESSGRREESRDRRLAPNSDSRRAPAQHRRPRHGLGSVSWFELFAFLFLSYNGGIAIYQSWGDVAAISQVAFTYSNIVSLLACLKLFRRAPPKSTGRNTLRASVWVLTMSLTFGYVYQVIGTTTKPTLQVALLQWAMPAATGIAVFILFCQEERSDPPLEEELWSVDV